MRKYDIKLLDRFATAAMQSILTAMLNDSNCDLALGKASKMTARHAYMYAQAMLDEKTNRMNDREMLEKEKTC